MKAVIAAAAGLFVGTIVGTTVGGPAEAGAQQQAATSYLWISECEIPAGTAINAAVAQATKDAAASRRTGEYKTLRLFAHHFGPRMSLYTIAEPRSWQSLETGMNKLVAAEPSLMTRPMACASHSDDILAEIPIP
jgi:hypothetical protein